MTNILTHKRSRRIKRNEISNSYSDEDDYISKQKENILEEKDEIFNPDFKLDILFHPNFKLTSKKGHFTYYSSETISTGDFYFEVEVTNLNFDIKKYIKSKCINDVQKKYYNPLLKNINLYLPNIRIGIVNSKCDLKIPIGAFGNSYSYRANDGYCLKGGKYISGNNIYKNGDIIGCLIHLKPPKPKFLENNINKENDLEDICYIKYYLNGNEQPIKIEGIKEGNYYMGVTLYNFAEAYINFSKRKMKYPPKNIEDGIKYICI